jgi:putative nucleotidyltransferase with HDIG domain
VSAIIGEIFELFARFGSGGYGEEISLEQHMLQTAMLAASLGAPEKVVAAALLHDIGYFLHADAETSIDEGRNIEHEALGAAWLSRGFDEAVTAPIALHVQAKRYLCAVEPGYFEQLSRASRLSLATQGGVMNESEVAAFESEPAFESALLLRRCDDGGKDLSMQTQGVEGFRGLLTGALRQTD